MISVADVGARFNRNVMIPHGESLRGLDDRRLQYYISVIGHAVKAAKHEVSETLKVAYAPLEQEAAAIADAEGNLTEHAGGNSPGAVQIQEKRQAFNINEQYHRHDHALLYLLQDRLSAMEMDIGGYHVSLDYNPNKLLSVDEAIQSARGYAVDVLGHLGHTIHLIDAALDIVSGSLEYCLGEQRNIFRHVRREIRRRQH